MLDLFGKARSWNGKTRCRGLVKSSPVVPWTLSLPSVRASDGLERLRLVFVAVEFLGICREQSIAQLEVNISIVPPKVQLSPSFPVFFLSLFLFQQKLSPDMRWWLPAPHQGCRSAGPRDALQCCSQLADLSCFPTRAHSYMPLSSYLCSLALEISFYLYFSIPGDAGRINMVWCRAKTLLWFPRDSTSFKRAI